MAERTLAGRVVTRPAAALAAVAVLAVAVVALIRGRANDPPRGPHAIANATYSEPSETTVEGVRWVANTSPREILLPDSVPPTRASSLLFFQGRPAHPHPAGGALAIDAGGGVIWVDERQRTRRLQVEVEGRMLSSVAPAGGGGLWLVTADGEVLRVDETGRLVSNQPGPFAYSLVASDASGAAWLVRSPERITFQPVFGQTPLLARLDAEGEAETTIGNGVVPPEFLLAHLSSAGRIAIGDSVIYYAPFIRDQIVALSMTGDTLWVAARDLPQAVEQPRFEIVDGEPMVDYAPVNLGLALGPDGLLYSLAVPGFTTAEGRIDVIDPVSGQLLRSGLVPTPLPTLAADETGRVYLMDEFSVLAGVAPRAREEFPPYDLETLDGRQFTSDDAAGTVTLINFWASWCAPCRIEMPELDALRESLADESDFLFITMNEDVNPHNAMLFMRDYGFEFPVLLGRDRLKRRYHYIGLPFTVLVDRDGRVVKRWTGYAGEAQIADIRAVIVAELERGAEDHSDHSDMDHETGGSTPEAAESHTGHDR